MKPFRPAPFLNVRTQHHTARAMSAAAKYEPEATADPDAQQLLAKAVGYHCGICNDFDCAHWAIDDIQILKNAAPWWNPLGPSHTVNGRLRCVTCDKTVRNGQLNTGTAIVCQRNPTLHRFEYVPPPSRKRAKTAAAAAAADMMTAVATNTKTAVAEEPAAADTKKADASFNFDFYCSICKKFNCRHWEFSLVQIDRGPDTTMWRIFGPYPITTCNIQCVDCKMFVQAGAICDGKVIRCLRRDHMMRIYKKETNPPRGPPVVATDAKTSAATDAKTPAVPDAKTPAVPDTKAAAVPDTKAAATTMTADTKTATVTKAALNVEDETLMCVECGSKFAAQNPCEHWRTGKSADGAHFNLWCGTCDDKHAITPFPVKKRTYCVYCPHCNRQILIGMQNARGSGWFVSKKPPRSKCEKCEGSGRMLVPTFINCPACAGTGGIPCICAGYRCDCGTGYKKKCRMCDGQRVLENASLSPEPCPFCLAK